MSDIDSGDDGAGSSGGGGRIAAIAIGVLVVIAGVIGVIALATGNDEEDSGGSTPPTDSAPTTDSVPATDSVPPDTQPPDTNPPDTEPPDTNPPDTEPPDTDPPDTDPPDTDPPDTDPPDTDPPVTDPPDGFAITIAGIDDGGQIPVEFTCDGTNQVPVVTLTMAPAETQQFALIMDDPDAPGADPFVHWVVYGIPAGSTTITDGVAEYTYGLNDVQLLDWFGPCPPPGDGPHEYVFTLYALSAALELETGLDGRALFTAIEPVIASETELRASYER